MRHWPRGCLADGALEAQHLERDRVALVARERVAGERVDALESEGAMAVAQVIVEAFFPA